MQEISPSVCGDSWFNLCTLITQCGTGLTQIPIRLGPVWLPKPAIIHTHSHNHTPFLAAKPMMK